MDAASEDTESVLAAYRERKRQALEAQRDGVSPPSSGTPEPQAAPKLAPSAGGESHFTFEHPLAAAAPEPAFQPPASTSAHAPPSPSGSALAPAAPRSAGLSTSPGATLSALGPALRLSDALLKDRRVSVQGSPALRGAGVVVLLLGLALVAFDRKLAQAGEPVREVLLAGLGLAGLGCLLVLLGMTFPRNRRLAVRLAASQREEWTRIQGETKRLTVLSRLGLGLAVAGLLGVAAAYSLASLALWALGALAAAAGVALLAYALVRRGVARRLYVQTLVLSGLEASGVGGGAPDGRVQPVILALDGLLGALPEAEVQRFLATPQAKAYLELVDEATRSQRGE